MFRAFGLALLLGLVLGLEREKDKAGSFAGIRTFPLIALTGCLCGLFSSLLGPWFFAVAFAVLALLVAVSYYRTASSSAPGMTTEITSLLTFLFGAMVWWNLAVPAAALTIVTALLLTAKAPLRAMLDRIGRADVIAAVQFGLITLVVLPILPNRAYGPLDALNPRRIWIMVTLIAGLNLAAYTLAKIMGARRGVRIAGFIGGLFSSTALTLSFSRRSRMVAAPVGDYALGICLASAMMFARVLILAFILNTAVARLLILPLGASMSAGAIGCLVLWMKERRMRHGSPAPELTLQNPCELWPAIQFGLLYALILLASKAAQVYIGSAGVYLSGFFAGLADLDAITLSLINLARHATLTAGVAAMGISIAAATNTAFKGGLAAFIGAAEIRRRTTPVFLAMIAAGLAGAAIVLLHTSAQPAP
jgi:uncharacterized membrane protein (DUF4010 family)